jgi:hypothetical protein
MQRNGGVSVRLRRWHLRLHGDVRQRGWRLRWSPLRRYATLDGRRRSGVGARSGVRSSSQNSLTPPWLMVYRRAHKRRG